MAITENLGTKRLDRGAVDWWVANWGRVCTKCGRLPKVDELWAQVEVTPDNYRSGGLTEEEWSVPGSMLRQWTYHHARCPTADRYGDINVRVAIDKRDRLIRFIKAHPGLTGMQLKAEGYTARWMGSLRQAELDGAIVLAPVGDTDPSFVWFVANGAETSDGAAMIAARR